LTTSFFLNTKLLSVVIFASTILFFYSFYLKKIPLVGNITVAVLTALAFLFGGLAVNNFQAAIIPASFAFLINLIRELVKDAEDIEGDKLNNVITFPIKYGIEKTRNTITVLSLLLIALTIYPFIDHSYNIEYFVVVMIVVNPILVFILKKLFEDTSKQNLNFISSMLKITMIFGLIAIYLGK
jgi:4-hydroxybenzoate polyprenyltransferase